MRKLITLLATALVVLVMGGTADAAPKDWSVKHDGGAAAGTARNEKTGDLSRTLILDGTLTTVDAGCYYVRLVVVHDWVVVAHESPRQCGPGRVPVSLSDGVSPFRWSAYVSVCRDGACGTDQNVTVYS